MIPVNAFIKFAVGAVCIVTFCVVYIVITWSFGHSLLETASQHDIDISFLALPSAHHNAFLFGIMMEFFLFGSCYSIYCLGAVISDIGAHVLSTLKGIWASYDN